MWRGIALCMALLSSPTFAVDQQFIRGDGLYKLITSEASNDRLKVLSYIVGVVDTVDVLQDAKLVKGLVCVPNGTTIGQLVDVVRKHLESNPKTWQEAGSTLVMKALGEAFPCR